MWRNILVAALVICLIFSGITEELKLFDGQIIDVLEEEEKIDSEVTGANEYEFRISNAIRKIKRKLHPPNPFSPATSTRIRRQLPTTPPSVRRLSLLTTTPLTPANPSSDEHDGNGNNSLQSGKLLMIIKHEVEAREMRDYIHIADNKAPITTTKIRATGNMGTTSVFVSRNATKNIRCYFCSGNHYASDCNTIVDVNKRKEHLLRVGRCFSCLRTGHVVKTCPSAKFCSFCRGKHHSSICERKSNNSGAESMPPNVTAISKEKKSTHVLLQTAKATAVNPSTGEKCSIRILFDNGSQRSYVTEDVVKKLQLKTEMKETLNLNTFGSAEYKSKNCKLVSFQIELNDGQLAVVNALSYPELCSPLPTLVEVNSFPHLQGLELADEVDIGSNDHINVLIGADQYHSIVVGDVIRGENGPVAVKSKLGWVLSGKLESSKISQDNFTSANLCIENPRLTESDKDKELVDTLKAFWEVENTGLDCNKLVDSNETDKFCDIRVQGDRYEVGLPWKPTEPKNMLRYARLPFGLRPSPAVLGSVLLQHVSSYQEKNPEIVKVLKGLFVDDLSTGGETVDKAYEIYQQSKQVMKEGNFNLRKWNSNSQELIERIRKSEGQATTGGSDPKLGEEDQSYVQSCIGLSADNETVKILGLHWNSSAADFENSHTTEYRLLWKKTVAMMLGLLPKIWMLSVVAFLFANANSSEDLEELSLDDGYPRPVMYVDVPPKVNRNLEGTKSQEEEQEEKGKDEKYITEAEQDAAEKKHGKKGNRTPRFIEMKNIETRLFNPKLKKLQGRRRIIYQRQSRRRRRRRWWG
eukprot:gene12833-3574_t